MKRARIFLVLPFMLLSGCGVSPYGWTYGPLVVGYTAYDCVHRAFLRRVYAAPGIRLDDFEQRIRDAEHENGVDYVSPPAANPVWKFEYEGKHAVYYGWFVKEAAPPPPASPAFYPDEIKDPVALAAKLKAGADPVSAWLFGQFSANGLAALTASPPLDANALREILATELNAVMNGPSIYDPTRFREVRLRPQTSRLVNFHPRFRPSESLLVQFNVALNRVLLEDAYPQELSKRQAIPWSHCYVAIQH